MRISVIVPLYNQAQYVNDCIDSLLDQTRSPHEIIVVNDGSTDESLKMVDRYPNIKLINQVNKGLSAARNTGIMHATGDYVLPLDADDIAMPELIEKISEVAHLTGADIISPSFKEFGIRQTKIILMPSPQLEDFKTGNRIAYCSAVKRSALLEVGGYSPRMWAGWEDYHLWFDLLSRGKQICTIPEILWLYRTKEYSMITEANKHADELWNQIAKDFPHVFGKSVTPPNLLPK